MQTLLIQPGGTGQTLALICFGVAILALLWVYRRNQHRLALLRRGSGGLPPSITEMNDRVTRAHVQINGIEEQERWRRLNAALPLQRQQAGLNQEQIELLNGISQFQSGSVPPHGAK